MTQTIAKQIKWDFETNGDLNIRDKDDKVVYFENSFGFWVKCEYDSQGNNIYYENLNGDWERHEYDSQGNTIYYEDSDGVIEDNRPKPCEDDYQAKAYNENEAIEMLRDVDGETMEHILRGIGMETQMLRQLMLSATMEQIEYLIEEKIGNQRHDTNK